MKILWISHIVPYPPKAGMLMRCFNLFSELGKHANVDLLALNQVGLLRQHFGSNEKGLKIAFEALYNYADRIEAYEFDNGKTRFQKILLALKCLFLLEPYSVRWLKSSQLEHAIKDSLSKNDYDLIHFDTVGLAQYLPLLKNYNIPLVLDHHNVESHMMLRRAQKTTNLLKKVYFYIEGLKLKHYEKNIIDFFKLHITCSDLDGIRLKSIKTSAIVKTVPNPVKIDSLSDSTNSLSSNSYKLLFVGGMDWYPNKDAVLHFSREIFPKILRNNGNVTFDIIGRAPCSKILNLQKQIPSIKVHGFVDSISDFYKNAHVYVCPIRDGGGTKLKVIDAMANRKLVIGYKEAFEGLEVTHNHDCLIANDKDEFAELVLKALKNIDLIYTMGNNARALVIDRYDKKVVGKSLVEEYKKLISC